ncbi:MAG: response regulator [Burkholderiaceae bacterium]
MKPTVLIVEDEAILARNLARSLTRLKVNTKTAGSFGSACKLLDDCEQLADLVCVDISLGDGNGLDFARRVQQRHPHIPVLVMTGQDSVSNRSVADSLNAVAFLSKPFSLSHFRELVGTLLLDERQRGASGERPGPRVMMYSHDSIGLGHMRRNTNIAHRLQRLVPDLSVLMVVGCPGGGLIDVGPGIDVIKLPSVTKIGRDRWRPASLRIGSNDLYALRSGLIVRAYEAFAPDLVLVDHEPAGVWNELLPLIEARARGVGAAHLVLGLRDILDRPESVAHRWREAGVNQLLGSAYRSVLIYGDEHVYPSASRYGLDRIDGLDHRYCGYVGNHPPPARRQESVRKERPQVLLAGGGGRDAYPMLAAGLQAIGRLPHGLRPEATAISGPLMDDELAANLESMARELGVRMLRHTTRMPELLCEADLLVCMGGYNTLVESITAGVPTLVVPRLGPSGEQIMRAELFTELGLIESASLEGDLVDVLARRLASTVRRRRSGAAHRPAICLDGADNAARAIAELLSARRSVHVHGPGSLLNA